MGFFAKLFGKKDDTVDPPMPSMPAQAESGKEAPTEEAMDKTKEGQEETQM